MTSDEGQGPVRVGGVAAAWGLGEDGRDGLGGPALDNAGDTGRHVAAGDAATPCESAPSPSTVRRDA